MYPNILVQIFLKIQQKRFSNKRIEIKGSDLSHNILKILATPRFDPASMNGIDNK